MPHPYGLPTDDRECEKCRRPVGEHGHDAWSNRPTCPDLTKTVSLRKEDRDRISKVLEHIRERAPQVCPDPADGGCIPAESGCVRCATSQLRGILAHVGVVDRG